MFKNLLPTSNLFYNKNLMENIYAHLPFDHEFKSMLDVLARLNKPSLDIMSQ